MKEDAVVAEVRKIRDEYAARFNYDLDAIVADIKKRERDGGVRVVSFPPKRVSQEHSPR